MTIAQVSSLNNVVETVTQHVTQLLKKKKNNPPPSDCLVLRLHYNYGFWLFGFLFWATFLQWYSQNPLTCVSHFNAESPVRYDYLNFCLTYLFVPSDEDANKRRYLFFYRWLHWAMFVVAIAYFLIRKFAKSFESKKLRKMYADVCSSSLSLESDDEKDTLEVVVRYLIEHLRSHNPVYINALLPVILALLVDGIAFWFVDYLLHNRFFRYGLYAFTTARDTENYSDYISKTFPPFAKCHLETQHQLTAGRDEVFGCHLGLMEVYEKLFFFVWVYLVVVISVTVGYLIKLCLYGHSYFQKIALKPKSPSMIRGCKDVDEKIMKVLKHCKVGDIYVLLTLKGYLSDTRFYMLLCRLSEPSLAIVLTHKPTPQPPAIHHVPAMPSRKSIKSRTPPQRNAAMFTNPAAQERLIQSQRGRL